MKKGGVYGHIGGVVYGRGVRTFCTLWYRGAPPMIECNLTHSPRCPQSTFSEVFHFKLRFLDLISDGLNGININSLT